MNARALIRPHAIAATGAILIAAFVFATVAAMDTPADPAVAPADSHRTADGFRNNYPHPGRASFWTWQWERMRKGLPREPPGGWHFLLERPDVAALAQRREDASLTWIGHATVLLQLDGVNILTDPQFSERASPVSFAGPRRVVPPALSLAELPHIDIVLISHNHYDHLDVESVKALARQAGGPPRFYVPLGLASWFRNLGVEVEAEMDWWQAQQDHALTVHFVPSQHWSGRTLWDRNRTLWGGFVVEHPRFRFFYTGDTGYSRDFADIQQRFGDFDLAALPIGAYEPRWFMAPQHIDPEEAVRIHQDVHARQSVAVHWGSFVLSDEPLDEPPRRLAQALAAAGVPPDAFWVLRHGETRRLAFRE